MDDEPFDELMGPRPSQLDKAVVSGGPVVTPDPSPTAVLTRKESSSSNGAAPPSNAFVHTHTSDRWAQYEQDEAQLKAESARASANAVAAAAERVARRESDAQDDLDRQAIEDRLAEAYGSLPPPERRDTMRRGSSGGGGFSFRNGRARPEEEQVVYDNSPDRVRAEALKVLEMADSGISASNLRRTSTGGFTTDREKRKPAALAGLDLSASSTRQSRQNMRDRRFSIDDEEEDGVGIEDVVDVVNMKNRVTAQSRGGGYEDDNDESTGSRRSSTSSWSSRYSMDHHLKALNGMTSSEMIQRLDREQERNATSARNMFRTSPHEPQPSTKIFGSGFTFRKKHVFGQDTPSSEFNLQGHRTVWMDNDPLNSNGRSLPPPLPDTKQHWQSNLERKRNRRRRICLAGLVAVFAMIIAASVIGATKGKGGDDVVGAAGDATDGVTFYVTSDVPYGRGETKKLDLDVTSLPESAEFLVHLGNIQDSSVTLCPPPNYREVSSVLKRSNTPVFILPGENDWNNCPDPNRAFSLWKHSFMEFESNFEHDLTVERQLGTEENFSFLHKGVLFIGLHVVGGRVDDRDKWTLRHTKNARWVDEQMSLYENDEFRAVVLFGNARPSPQQSDFFSEMIAHIKKMGKPAVYIHANAADGNDFLEYKPFPEASNLLATEIRNGGTNPPLRVTVGFGKRPFVVG